MGGSYVRHIFSLGETGNEALPPFIFYQIKCKKFGVEAADLFRVNVLSKIRISLCK
jgi:hypothetical protein